MHAYGDTAAIVLHFHAATGQQAHGDGVADAGEHLVDDAGGHGNL